MADITKCSNESCLLIDCFRKTAKDGYYQSYARFEPNDKGVCEYYKSKK